MCLIQLPNSRSFNVNHLFPCATNSAGEPDCKNGHKVFSFLHHGFAMLSCRYSHQKVKSISPFLKHGVCGDRWPELTHGTLAKQWNTTKTLASAFPVTPATPSTFPGLPGSRPAIQRGAVSPAGPDEASKAASPSQPTDIQRRLHEATWPQQEDSAAGPANTADHRVVWLGIQKGQSQPYF